MLKPRPDFLLLWRPAILFAFAAGYRQARVTVNNEDSNSLSSTRRSAKVGADQNRFVSINCVITTGFRV
ncbi:MAG: hypothetical protein R3F38_10095 [Gammaproteobacteria bacterium]